MSNFFISQLDYVYFFYGLSFITLAAVAGSSRQWSRSSLPWGWLALFGWVHGFHEWLGIAAQWVDGSVFEWSRCLCLLISFICLLEFGRAGTVVLYGKGVRRWIFLPLLVPVCVAAAVGINELNATTRYVFGLTGALWAAWVLFKSARLCSSRSLKVAALGMACYALATGVIVPSANFFPASVLNQAVFLKYVGFPIEWVRGILAFLIAGMIGRHDLHYAVYFYHSRQVKEEARYYRWITWSITLLLILGWMMAEGVDRHEQKHTEGSLLVRAQTAAASLNLERVRSLTASPEDEDTEDYQRLRQQLSDIARSDSKVYFVSLYGFKDGEEFNYVCSESKGASPNVGPGFIYHTEIDESDIRFFNDGKPIVRGPYTDDQGKWVSALVPVLREDDSSRLRVALSMDVDARDWQQGIAFYRLMAMGFTLMAIACFVGFFSKYHQEKMTALGINESLRWKQALFENNAVGIVVLDKNRNIIEVNSRFTELHGYPLKEIIGLPASNLIVSQDAPRLLEAKFAEALKSDNVVHVELELLHKDGTYFWAEIFGRFIDVNQPDKGIICTFFDITKRKNSEAKLAEARRSEKLLQEIINRSPVAVFVWKAAENWPVEYVSGRTEEILGYPPEDFLKGKISYASIIHPDDLYRIIGEVTNYNKQGVEDFSQEYRIVTRQGEVKWIDERTYVWRDEHGNPVRHQGVIVDITERKLAEEERIKMSKLQSVELLAAGVAHDLNNILTSLSANVQLAILEQEMGKNVTERLQSADNACDRAAQLASQLLSFSKPNAPVVKTVDMGELVKAVTRFSLHGSKCVADISVPAKKWLANVDENQMGQVINNIVLNAIQAMPHGGKVTVRVDDYQWDQEDKLDIPPGTYIKISIADEGVGIDPERRSRIFDPYFTTKQAGSGLGLTTSYSIVKRHKGAMTVDSEVGRGSCFSIYLPVLPPDTPLASGAEQVKIEPKLQGSLKALFMDDDSHVRTSVQNLFNLMGYQVDVAANGEQALEMFKKASGEGQPYHFVMLDLTVPGGMGGKTVMSHLREIDPNVIAIVVSGYTDNPVMINYEESGFCAALSKPLRIQAVKEVLKQIEERVEKKKNS